MAAAAAAICSLGCEEPTAAPAVSAPMPPSACLDARSWKEELARLDPSSVARVEPRYQWYMCKGSAIVVGTKVVLRSTVLSAAETARLLACPHNRVFFAESADSLASSPWSIPSGWVDIDVEPHGGGVGLSPVSLTGDGVAVTLSADSITKNIHLLRDTRAFASASAAHARAQASAHSSAR